MPRHGFDRGAAAAEARLERLDDAEMDGERGDPASATPLADLSTVRAEGSLHVEEDWFATSDDDDVPDPTDLGQTDLADCLDTFAEAFNARDLDGVLELVAPDCEAPGLGNDVEHFPDALEDLWERRPSVLLTRGQLQDGPVGVLWELGGESAPSEGWWPLATVHFSDVRDGCAGVLAFSTDPQLLDDVVTDPPDTELEEGARWVEWDEGALD